jgi:hypothetical protein
LNKNRREERKKKKILPQIEIKYKEGVLKTITNERDFPLIRKRIRNICLFA